MTDLREEIERIFSPAIDARAPYAKVMIGMIVNVITRVRREAIEECALKIRADCPMCEDGRADHGKSEHECEYCGRPMVAARALLDGSKA